MCNTLFLTQASDISRTWMNTQAWNACSSRRTGSKLSKTLTIKRNCDASIWPRIWFQGSKTCCLFRNSLSLMSVSISFGKSNFFVSDLSILSPIQSFKPQQQRACGDVWQSVWFVCSTAEVERARLFKKFQFLSASLCRIVFYMFYAFLGADFHDTYPTEVFLSFLELTVCFVMMVWSVTFSSSPAQLPKLQTLTISNNKLETVEDIEELLHCQSLSVLDLKDNQLEDPACVDVFEQMPSLVRAPLLTINWELFLKKLESQRRRNSIVSRDIC